MDAFSSLFIVYVHVFACMIMFHKWIFFVHFVKSFKKLPSAVSPTEFSLRIKIYWHTLVIMRSRCACSPHTGAVHLCQPDHPPTRVHADTVIC